MSRALTTSAVAALPKRDCDRMLAATAVNSLAELARRNKESKIYDFVVAIKDGAAAIETWVTPGLNVGDLR